MWRNLLLPLFFVYLFTLNADSAPLTSDELAAVNKPLYAYMAQSKFTPLARTLFYAYLAAAQNDFAWESHKRSGKFEGTFAPVSLAVLRLFDPDAEIEALEGYPKDPYSEAITQKVMEPLTARFKGDEQGIKNYPIKEGKGLWHPTEGYYGLNFATILPWYLTEIKEFRPASPNLSKENLLKECAAVQRAMQKLDKANLLAIDYWANQGDWIKIAEKYMQGHKTPIELTLLVRSTLFKALSDSLGSVFDAKYTYWAPRPSQVDPQIQPVIPLPSHPSYPSAHSALGKTAATILAHYFPEDKAKWEQMAEQAGLSRILAGIHYPMDHISGRTLGEQVANKALTANIQSR